MVNAASEAVGRAYDARAREYVELFGDEERLAGADRDLVVRWRDSTRGLLLDAGCGPGQWTALLGHGGRRVLGLDVSERFLAHARDVHPGATFVRGSLHALPLADGSAGGVLAWYSTIHVEPEALPGTFDELRRVLSPGGSLLLGFFGGPPAEPFAHAVTTAYFWSADALGTLLVDAGFVVVEHHRRREEGFRPLCSLVAVAVPPAAAGAGSRRRG